MNIEIYTWTTCPFCVRAKALLSARGLAFEEHVMDGDFEGLAEVKRRLGHPTVPIVLIDGELVGGYRELAALDARGALAG
jgi:glutaredoxin 3